MLLENDIKYFSINKL